MILLDHVTKQYPVDAHPALDNISLHISPNEFVFLVGESGAGKSTLLKMITKEESPDTGKIVIGGIDLDYVKKRHIPHYRRRLGVVFQDFKLLPMRTVYENVAFALEIAGMSNREIERTVPTVLNLVGLDEEAYKFPNELSGGQAQLVSIARSVARQPKILIADEPTGNLDPHTGQEIVDLLKKINDYGTTVLVTTHDAEVVNRLKKRVITLKDGKIVSDQKERGIYRLDSNNDGINLQRPGHKLTKEEIARLAQMHKAAPAPAAPAAPAPKARTTKTTKSTKPATRTTVKKKPLNTPGRSVI